MRFGIGVAVALVIAGAPAAMAAEPGAPAPVSFARMGARIPTGTVWAVLQYREFPMSCADIKKLTWSEKNNRNAGGPEFERVFREEFAAAGLRVTGDPNNLFQADDKSADLQIGALITSVSATFCQVQTFRDAFDSRDGHGMKGQASMAIEWQVYSTSQAKVVARVPTSGAYRLDKEVEAGDQLILQRAFAANVQALAASPEFRTAISGLAPAALASSGAAIAFTTAAPGAVRPIKDAAGFVATVFAGGGWAAPS